MSDGPANPQVRLPETVVDRAEEIEEEYGCRSRGEAIRLMLREPKKWDV